MALPAPVPTSMSAGSASHRFAGAWLCSAPSSSTRGALEGALREAVLPPLRSHPTARQGSGTLNRDDQNRLEQSLADKVRSYGIDTLDMPKSTRIAVQERRWSRRSTPSESTERR